MFNEVVVARSLVEAGAKAEAEAIRRVETTATNFNNKIISRTI